MKKKFKNKFCRKCGYEWKMTDEGECYACGGKLYAPHTSKPKKMRRL